MEEGFSLGSSTIGIVGLGLMGGSLAMSLSGHCARIIGFDSHPPTLELALSKGIVDEAGTFTQSRTIVDVLVLATPVPAILNLLQRLPSLISHPCIVMDIGSTKRDILQAMSALPEYFDPIGGHPICGKEKLGLENTDAYLYRDAPFVVTPLTRTTARARSAATQIISMIGAGCVELTAEEHDRILASTSHLPFLLSSALAGSTIREVASLIGPGFRSTSRLAGTPSHMMMGILKSNRDNILQSIQQFRKSLCEIETLLQNEEYAELQNVLDASRTRYFELNNNP